MLKELMDNKKISMYRLSKESGIPYSTINDLCSGKSRLEKSSAETLYQLAKALDVSMEELIEPYLIPRASFENYKSSVCHKVRELGDVQFILDTLESDKIHTYMERRWFPESLYLLAMLDYLSRENDIPLCTDYDDLRRMKLEQPVFPASLYVYAIMTGTDEGTMSYSILSIDPETGEETEEIAFEDVQLTPGKTMVSEIKQDEEESTQLFVVNENQEAISEILPTGEEVSLVEEESSQEASEETIDTSESSQEESIIEESTEDEATASEESSAEDSTGKAEEEDPSRSEAIRERNTTLLIVVLSVVAVLMLALFVFMMRVLYKDRRKKNKK